MDLVNQNNNQKIDDLNILTDEAVVRMAREGSSYAYDILISKYRELAKNVARKYYINGGDNEDVVQEGMIGIFKAIRDFNLDGNSSFKYFASLCIERQIQTAVSGANREKHKILNESLPLYTGNAKEEEDEQEQVIPDVAIRSGGDEPEKLAMLRETVMELSELSREELSGFETIVFDMMIQGKTYKEIAIEMGRPPKSVDNAIQRIKKKLGHAVSFEA